MKYLTKEYWKSFEKTIIDKNGKEKKVKDGAKFEYLIEDLLILMYRGKGIAWEKTQTTHDGNKDFIGKKNGKPRIWAECKNYRADISLKTIAPTLVMAELGGINEILVFSYSAINTNTKEKLLKYADKREKKIYYYDDINLENLLFRFRKLLFPKYFKEFSRMDVLPSLLKPYVFSCCMPGIYYNKSEEIDISSFNLKLNELVFVGIGIINNSYYENIEAEISFDKENDLDYIEIIDSSTKNSLKASWKRVIKMVPGEAVLCKLYFRPVRFKKEFSLPSIRIDFNNIQIKSEIIKFKKIKCDYLFCTPFIGSEYISALENLDKVTINKAKMSLALVHGKSGVGKTRFLQEALVFYTKNHYNILNFMMNSLTKDSFLIMREIISFIYNLTPEMVIESLKEYKEETSIWGTEQLEIISLLQSLLLDDNYQIFRKLLFKCKYLLFEKILAQRTVLIIDNIQFAEPWLIDFLYELCVYAKNRNSTSQFVLILSYNVDYYCNNSIKNLRIFCEELKKQNFLNVFLHEIKGMENNNLSLGFLKELIHINKEIDNVYLNSIVKKANHVPKHIENIVEYLLGKKAIVIKDNYFVVKDSKLFYDEIENMPKSFSEIFAKRYDLFLAQEGVSEKEVVNIISAIHFWGYISKEQINYFCFNQIIIDKLEQYGFIDLADVRYYQFNHDLYELFFMKKYSLEEHFINFVINEKYYNYSGLGLAQRILISLKQKEESNAILKEISSQRNIAATVPYKLKDYFYHQIIEYLATNYKKAYNFDEFMECVRILCLEAKNTLGFHVSKTLFESIYKVLQNVCITKRESSPGYQNFINEYCENLLQNNDSSVINIYNERVRYWEQFSESGYTLLARLYNRIYVYYKHSKKEEIVHRHLEKSQILCQKYNLLDLHIENLYDEGNYYLYVPNKKSKLIKCWSEGYQVFESNNIILEHLTLNSLKKKVQLELLCNRYERVEDYIERAFDYIETGKYNEQGLFFNASMYHLKAIYGLISGKLSVSEIEDTLDTAARYYVLKNNEKPFAIHFLYAKLCYNKNEYQKMLLHYNYSLQNLKRTHFYHAHISQIIIDDCCFKISMIRKKEKNITLNYDEIVDPLSNACQKIINFSEQELDTFLEEFQSVSNISDESLKDGYIY